MGRGKTSLLLGVTGFIGTHLAPYLAEKGEVVVGTYLRLSKGTRRDSKIRLVECDATRKSDIERVVRRFSPDYVYYLAGQSSVREAWFDPVKTIQINFLGGVHLLETVRQWSAKTRVLIFSSGTTYGLSHLGGRSLREGSCLTPKDPYSLSKMSLDLFGRFYAKVYGLEVFVVRLANIVGPGQSSTFSISNFAYQIAGIEAGLLPERIEVGNLLAKRDYLDIRDCVRALYLVMMRGESGEAYNIASGKSRNLRGIIAELIGLSKLRHDKIKIVKKRSLMSKDEIPSIRLNPSKFRRLTGWKPEIPFRQTLVDVLNDWRRKWNET